MGRADRVAARRRGGDALRLECRAGSRGGRGPRRAGRRRSARSASGPSTPRRRSPGPDPAWSRGPSSSPTCFTRIGLAPRKGWTSNWCPSPRRPGAPRAERREMGLNWAEHTVEIAAPIKTCFDAITDYETFPEWQSAVVDTEVLDWDEQGRGKRVRLFVDAKVRKVDYTLDYRYERAHPNRVGLRRGQRHQRRRRPLPLRGPGRRPHAGHLQARPRGRHPAPRPGRPSRTQVDPEGLGRGPEARGGTARRIGRPRASRRAAPAGGRRGGRARRRGSRSRWASSGPSATRRPPPPRSRPTTTGALMELTRSPSCPAWWSERPHRSAVESPVAAPAPRGIFPRWLRAPALARRAARWAPGVRWRARSEAGRAGSWGAAGTTTARSDGRPARSAIIRAWTR